MTETINLDEIVGELKPHKVIIDGKTFWANPDPSVEVLWSMSKLDLLTEEDSDELMAVMRDLLTEIFGEEVDEILRMCGTRRISALLAAMMEAYTREGKAPGSSRASRRAGVRSKPTSKGSTASTSAKPASGRNGSAAVASSV